MRLIFIKSHTTDRGDCYRAGLAYVVNDADLVESLRADRIAYFEDEEPPFAEADLDSAKQADVLQSDLEWKRILRNSASVAAKAEEQDRLAAALKDKHEARAVAATKEETQEQELAAALNSKRESRAAAAIKNREE